MPYLIIDTETNALMDYERSAEAKGQARIAEFAGITLDHDLKLIESFQRYVQRDGWEMTPEATAKNGITDAMLDRQGVPIAEVLDWWERQIRAGYNVIAFNAQFDCKLLRAELALAGRDKLFYETKNACMMRDAKPFAAHVGRTLVKHGFKKDGVTPISQNGWPKLSDLCIFLGIEERPRHNALDDVLSTYECLHKMISLGYVPDPQVHESKNLEAIRSAS